jgi:N-acetylglucosamine transport system substrate-binding protein
MVVAPTPAVTSTDKLSWQAISAYAGESFIVPAKAKNLAGGKELLRMMLSKAGAANFTNETKTLTIVNGAADSLQLAKTDTALKSQLQWLNNGHTAPTYPSFPSWYAQMNTDVGNAIGQMMQGKTTPREFMATAQSVADQTRSDPNVTKYHR